MAGVWDESRGGGVGRAWPAAAISLVAHAAVLLALGLLIPKPRYTFIPTPPSLTFKLVRTQAEASVHTARASGAATPALAGLPPSAPLRLHVPVKSEPARTSGESETSTREAGAGPSAPASLLRFYAGDLVGCGREDIALMSDEEKAVCLARIAAAEGRGRYPKDQAPFSGIDPAKASAWAAQQARDAERRDGTQAQAALKALQDARPPIEHKGTRFDINVGVRCKLVLATGKMDCHGGNPLGP